MVMFVSWPTPHKVGVTVGTRQPFHGTGGHVDTGPVSREGNDGDQMARHSFAFGDPSRVLMQPRIEWKEGFARLTNDKICIRIQPDL
jgi:hypothetical protein